MKFFYVSGADEGIDAPRESHNGKKNFVDIKATKMGSATEAQIWALKAYWLSYRLAGLNALVKDMQATFEVSGQPEHSKDMLGLTRAIVDSSDAAAKILCNYSTNFIDQQEPESINNGAA